MSKRRLDLHRTMQQINGEPGVVVCTYGFGAEFFESYCLERIGALANSNNISILLDRDRYNDMLTGSTSEQPKHANLHYLLNPVAVPGAFHPKIFLFADAKRGTLFIGSANLTEPGLTANAELVGVHNFELGKNEEHWELFQAVFEYLNQIAESHGTKTLRSNLDQLASDAPWLAVSRSPNTERSALTFLHNLTTPLLDQIAGIAAGRKCEVLALSRFFDREPNVLDEIKSRIKAARIRIYTQNRFTTLRAEWLSHPLIQSGDAELYLCEFEDDGHIQALHAKALCVHMEKETLYFYGSANFTTPALLRTARTGNAEAGILMRSSSREFRSSVRRLFDPDDTAVRLQNPEQLISSYSEPVVRQPSPPIRLKEADFRAPTIFLEAEILEAVPDSLALRVEFSPEHFEDFTIGRRGELFTATVPEATCKRLSQRSTVLRIVHGSMILSNPLLLTNLIDVQTGDNVQKQRNIRRAQESASQFLTVLGDLLKGHDDDALQTFLMFCDIPVAFGPRSPIRGRTDWNPRETMRAFGAHPFHTCKSLHDAVLYFVERHLRKLRRHNCERDPDGIPNFLHIFLAVGGVLRAQFERVIQSLEGKSGLITVDEWADCRSLCDVYFRKFEEMMLCLGPEYIEPLVQKHSRRKIHEQLVPDMDALRQTYEDMLDFRNRIEKMRLDKCHYAGSDRPFQYFQSLLGDKSWTKYRKSVEGVYHLIENVAATGLAAAGS